MRDFSESESKHSPQKETIPLWHKIPPQFNYVVIGNGGRELAFFSDRDLKVISKEVLNSVDVWDTYRRFDMKNDEWKKTFSKR